MRKMLVFLTGLIIVAVACVYIFIPEEISFSKVCLIKINGNVAKRYLTEESYWRKWWPQQNRHTTDSFFYNDDFTYQVNFKTLGGANIKVEKKDSVNTDLSVISIGSDTAAIEWSGKLPATNNFFTRIIHYRQALTLKKSMTIVLDSAKSYLEKNTDLYQVAITQTKVKDTILIATSSSSAAYPSTEIIYGLIKNLKKYISENNATETNFPMLNIAEDHGTFNTMVAIPINKIIDQTQNYFLKRMVPGKILVAEKKGGVAAAHNATEEVKMFMDDHHLSSPAKPFESLVTNRMEEPDSNKWITKIYYPIF